MEENKIEWFDDYDLFKSFYTHKVRIFTKDLATQIYVELPTIKDFLNQDSLSMVFNLFRQPLVEIKDKFSIWNPQSYFHFFQLLLFELRHVKEFLSVHQNLSEFLDFIWQDNEVTIDWEHEVILINNYILDETLWDYIWYVLWCSFGEKRTKPRVFQTQAEKEYFQQQQATEDRIRQIRARGSQITTNKNQDAANPMLTIYTVILYKFQQFTLLDLYNLTNAQINWLYEYACRISNYEVESKIFASGNSKKKKLKFFTEK